MNEKQSQFSLIHAEDVQRFEQALDRLGIAEQTFRRIAAEMQSPENGDADNNTKLTEPAGLTDFVNYENSVNSVKKKNNNKLKTEEDEQN
jgi:hypothetical protein